MEAYWVDREVKLPLLTAGRVIYHPKQHTVNNFSHFPYIRISFAALNINLIDQLDSSNFLTALGFIEICMYSGPPPPKKSAFFAKVAHILC